MARLKSEIGALRSSLDQAISAGNSRDTARMAQQLAEKAMALSTFEEESKRKVEGCAQLDSSLKLLAEVARCNRALCSEYRCTLHRYFLEAGLSKPLARDTLKQLNQFQHEIDQVIGKIDLLPPRSTGFYSRLQSVRRRELTQQMQRAQREIESAERFLEKFIELGDQFFEEEREQPNRPDSETTAGPSPCCLDN